MATSTQPAPPSPVTRAADRYLEQYGDPLVTNTYLKLAVLCLAALAAMMGGLVYKSQKALASAKPFIIRINDVGQPQTQATKQDSRSSPGPQVAESGTASRADGCSQVSDGG